MPDVQIQVPTKLTDTTVLRFGIYLRSLPLAERYVLDLSGLGHVEPFGMLVCASLLRRFVAERKQAGASFAAIGYSDNSYAAHMGLYQAFGLPHGKKPGEASGSDRYIPLTCLKLQDLRRIAGYGPVGEAIDVEAKRLAGILLRRTDGKRLSHVSYALLEIMRNVAEHSHAEEIWCVGQCWPTRGCVEIAILDEGIGIRSSLARHPSFRYDNDEEAILRALEAGVSGSPPKSEAEQFHDAYDDGWQNAGMGLFVISQLCAEGGEFSIASGDTCLSLSQAGCSRCETHFVGTAIRMRLDTVADADIRAFIDRIIPRNARRGRSALWSLDG